MDIGDPDAARASARGSPRQPRSPDQTGRRPSPRIAGRHRAGRVPARLRETPEPAAADRPPDDHRRHHPEPGPDHCARARMTRVLTSALHISGGEAEVGSARRSTLAERMSDDRGTVGAAPAAPGREAARRTDLRRERRCGGAGVGAGDPARVRPRPDRRRGTTPRTVRHPVRTEGPTPAGQAGGGSDRPGRHPARRKSCSRTGGSSGCDPPRTADMPESSGSPGTAGRNCCRCCTRWRNRGSTAPAPTRGSWSKSRTRVTTGSGCTTRSMTCATGCSAPTTPCQTPAGRRRR